MNQLLNYRFVKTDFYSNATHSNVKWSNDDGSARISSMFMDTT